MPEQNQKQLTDLKLRRTAFEPIVSNDRVRSVAAKLATFHSERGHYEFLAVCPCCGYPGNSAPQNFDICLICGWQDDCSDDGRGSDLISVANGDRSLNEARKECFQWVSNPFKDCGNLGDDLRSQIVHLRLKLVDMFDRLVPEIKVQAYIDALPLLVNLSEKIHRRERFISDKKIIDRETLEDFGNSV